MLSHSLTLLAAAATVAAHGYVQEIVDSAGTVYTGYLPVCRVVLRSDSSY